MTDRTANETTVHACPPPGSGLTPCCGRTPFELPRTDRMSSDPADVTCSGAEQTAPQPDFTSPIAGRIEVREPCPWCADRPMVPRSLMDMHVARMHPEVQTINASAAPAVQASATDQTAPAPRLSPQQRDALYDAIADHGPTPPTFTEQHEQVCRVVARIIDDLTCGQAGGDRVAVLPPPTLTEEGRLRLRVQVLEEDAERDQGLAKVGARCMREGHQGLIESGRAVIEGHRFALSVALGLGTGAPWDAIHERLAELLLRLLVDEAQPPAPRCMCGTTVCESDACDCDSASCPVDHADEAQQDGARS